MTEWTVPGYTELKTLGSGGFGAVVLARHDATGTPVAIKYLLPELRHDPDFAAMFRAEAEALGALDDPHVVRLYEYVESSAGAAIVMELVDGVTLWDILSRHGRTTPEAALAVLFGSLLGLAAAHARGVVHRDYKPRNVLINARGASKLTDFGIAARAGTPTVPSGSVAYAPPEQFDGGPASPASDVYAATATFYECLAGHPPFTGATMDSVIELHRSASVPMEPVPAPLRPIVARGMAKDPAYRPADAAALAAELRAAAAGAYGQDWEQRGRTSLGEAALLLALLWPTAGMPALQGSAVEQVHLTHGSHSAQAPHAQAASHPHATRPELHHWHLRHLLHLDHLAHLRSLRREPAAEARAGHTSGARKASRAARHLRTTATVVTAAAVVAAGVTVALTSRASNGPGTPGHPAVAAYRAPLAAGPPGTTPLATIPVTLVGTSDPAGDTYGVYNPSLPHGSLAQLYGEIKDPTTGEVARLYAQQFPYTSPPAPVQSATLKPGYATAEYSFVVYPTIATRYQVRLLRSATAATPLTVSAIRTAYIVGDYSFAASNPNSDPVNDGVCPDFQWPCTATYPITVYAPPSALQTEMSRQKYLYVQAGSVASRAPMQLVADATFSAPQRVGDDEYEVIVSFTSSSSAYTDRTFGFCTKQTEAQDGIGLPGPSACGSEGIPSSASYIWVGWGG